MGNRQSKSKPKKKDNTDKQWRSSNESNNSYRYSKPQQQNIDSQQSDAWRQQIPQNRFEEEDDLQRALAASLKRIINSNSTELEESTQGIPSSVGCVGLANLGNTCFMNSIIQCLSNTPRLRSFFNSSQYKQDINKVNSTKEKLANEFGTLMSDIWSGNYKVIQPHLFKDAVSQYAPQFFDEQQQHKDSEKFLAFLLNGLHEALNVMSNKPNTQQIESQDKRDAIIADLSWKMYLKRNKSKIVELFGAQQKTHIFCPDCNRQSIRFDPYMYLSVPIAGADKKSLIVDIFHRKCHNPINKPIRHVFHIKKYEKVRDLAKRVANIYETKEKFVLFYENWNMKVAREYEHNLMLGMVPNRDALACYILKDWNEEVTPRDIKEKKINIQLAKLCHSQPLSNPFDSRSNGPLFGMPMVICFLNIHSRRELHQIIYQRLFQWVGPDILNQPPYIEKLKQIKKEKTDKKEEQQDDDNADEEEEMDKYESVWDGIFESMPYRLRLMPYKHFSFSSTAIPEEIAIDDITFEESIRTKDIDIIIEWNDTAYHVIRSIVNKVVVDAEYAQWKREAARKAANGDLEIITLYDCINEYIAPEIFENDGWFCTKHKKANRKLDIWSSPETLIIHLKRFQVLGIGKSGTGEKISHFVDCPIRGLDLSQYVNMEILYSSLISLINGYFLINFDKNIPTDIIQICVQYSCSDLTPIYDLYAVSSHSGGYDNGHYTSYAINTDSKSWYYFNDSSVRPAKESDVISSSSYILFYKKCSWTQLMDK